MTDEGVQQRIDYCRRYKSESLDLSECGLSTIPVEISNFTWLKNLDLSSNQISKIEGLESLVNLSTLDFSSNQILKIEGLESLVNLSTLLLYYNQISKIEG